MALAYYISHPQVKIDPAVAVPDWTLSEGGASRLTALKDSTWVRSLSLIASSAERKAVDTAVLLARFARCPVKVYRDMGENDRSATGYLPPAEFEAVADAFFASPDVSVRGWERAIDAQSRIVRAVESVLDAHGRDTPLAFSGHGGVGTLLYCYLAGEPISRRRDQPPGGGNVFAFDIASRRPVFSWTPLESISTDGAPA